MRTPYRPARPGKKVSQGVVRVVGVEIEVGIPLDPDGFLRRECPSCLRQFKWLPSEDSEPTGDGLYGCPYCQIRSGSDSLWTQEQSDYLTWVGGQEALKELSTSFFKVEPSPPPPVPTDPGDMVRVDFSCHPGEPIKVYEGWPEAQPIYCIVCGAER